LGVEAGVDGAAGVDDEADGLSLDLDVSDLDVSDLDASLDSAGFDSLEDSEDESELLGA
jgi:hypothetical protein